MNGPRESTIGSQTGSGDRWAAHQELQVEAVASLTSSREEEKMRLLILANTLPILVEASDQGPLTAPQLFSQSCASCARAKIAKSQRREKCEANLVIEEDVWGKGSCLSSTPHIQRAREGEKQTSHLSDDVDSGVWSEGTTDKESVGDTKEEEVDIPNTSASQERTVNGADRAEEASAFLEEVQRQVRDKIDLMSRLESRMEVVQGVHRQLKKVKKENGRLEERLRQVEEENRALQDKLAALETKNAEVAEKKPITKTESNSRSDCCKEACASLRALVESFKERAQMLLQGLGQEELVRQNDLRASVGQAHKEDKGEHLAQEGDDGEALAREGAGEENFAQEGAGGEHLAHGGDGEQDLEQEEDGADDVAQVGVGGEHDAQAQDGEEDLAQEGVE